MGPEPIRFVPGTLLADRYQIVSVLGSGGMGEVYRANDLRLGEPVALKFLPEAVEHDPRKLGMLLAEARLARKVSHPNVCRVHDVAVHRTGAPGGLHFLSMEYIEGEDLASLLHRIGRLPQDKALEISAELCAGLAAVHGSGLLHRDIKPGNVMIDQSGRPRLTDFGLAIPDRERGIDAGTPAYMAPEQITGHEATLRSDLYALGLVLYEIFTGVRAFRADSPEEYARLHREKSPGPPSAHVEGLAASVERLILQCLEKDPTRRPPSAESLAEALGSLAIGDASRPGIQHQETVLRALLLCDLWNPSPRIQELGNRREAELEPVITRLTRDLLAEHGGRELEKTGGFLLLFEHPLQAVRFALDYHQAVHALGRREGGRRETGSTDDRDLFARVGIHFGDVRLQPNSADDVALGARPIETGGLTKVVTAQLMALARGGQTLLGRSAFDLARRAAVELEDAEGLRWLDHGAWHLQGVTEPVDVFEVGHADSAPLSPPSETEGVRRLIPQPRIEGWRPAPGLSIPQRRHWRVEKRLGEGGFGEVWLARHHKTGERRSFKFCFDAERLRALQREITLFRLLKEELGERKDISRILDWNLEEAPYFIESEYTSVGSLEDWARASGGPEEVPLATRLEIVAQVATALAAAHSVGVLHKDVKPSNVLIQTTDEGVQAQLADFGIGQLTERERLAEAGITVLGLSQRTQRHSASAPSGTRLYLAPELLEGRPPTQQADIYALGVMLYQLVVGDLGRALAPGWRRDVADDLLADDIASIVDRSPERRPASAQEVAERLRNLEARRRERRAEAAAREELEAARRRRKVYRAVATTSLVALVVVSMLAIWALRASREERLARESTELILDFMVDLFEITDPFDVTASIEKRRTAVTARELLDHGAERVETEFEHQPLVRARLMDTFGELYRSLGHYEKAGPLLEQSLEIRRRLLGEHPDLAISLRHKGRLLADRGERESALAFHREALQIQEELLGTEHPETLESMSRVAINLRKLGELEQARQLQAQTLEIRERVLGPEHPDTLSSQADLALALWFLGEFDPARRLQEETLEVRERVLGPEHPETVISMNDLAVSLQSAGDLVGAKSFFERTLQLQEQLLGAEHRDTLRSMGNLATTLRDLGEFTGARGLQERALEIQSRILGAEHLDTLIAMGNLAETLRDLGDLEQARDLSVENRKVGAEVLGEDHPYTLWATLNLAQTLWKMGETEGAKKWSLRALQGQQAVLGPTHPFTTLAVRFRLEIARQEGDVEAVTRWLEELRWLTEVEEATLTSAEHRQTREYVLQMIAELGAESSPPAP